MEHSESKKAVAAAAISSSFAIAYGIFKCSELLGKAQGKALSDLTLPLPTQFLLDLKYLPYLVPPVLIGLLLSSKRRPLLRTILVESAWLYSLAWPLISIAAWYFPYAH